MPIVISPGKRKIILRVMFVLACLSIIGVAVLIQIPKKQIKGEIIRPEEAPIASKKPEVVTPDLEQIYPPVDSIKLFNLIQDWRRGNGYKAFAWEPSLEDEAYGRLAEIKKDWSHSGFWTLEQKEVCGERDCWYGENLAKDVYDEQLLLNTWVKSPSHLANLKAPYTGTYIACKDRHCVQLFISK